MNDSVRTIHLGTNGEIARAYFPQLVRSLPQYRANLLHCTHTWTLVSQYVSTFFVALACASSQQDLAILQQEISQFNNALPLNTCYQIMGSIALSSAISDLAQQGRTLLGNVLYRDHVFKFLSILAYAFSQIGNQADLDLIRQTLEPISTCLGHYSSCENEY